MTLRPNANAVLIGVAVSIAFLAGYALSPGGPWATTHVRQAPVNVTTVLTDAGRAAVGRYFENLPYPAEFMEHHTDRDLAGRGDLACARVGSAYLRTVYAAGKNLDPVLAGIECGRPAQVVTVILGHGDPASCPRGTRMLDGIRAKDVIGFAKDHLYGFDGHVDPNSTPFVVSKASPKNVDDAMITWCGHPAVVVQRLSSAALRVSALEAPLQR